MVVIEDASLGETTYGIYTLQKAVNACEDFYKPIMVSATEDFNDILPRLVEMDFYRNPRYGSGDIGFGRLFADVFKKIARYVPERKKWFVYDGKRWVPDIANLSIMELGKDLADAILLYASTIHDEKSRLNYLKETKCWQQRRFRETFIKEAQSVYPLSIESFDSNIYLFNCNNVTLNLKDGMVKEHAPEDLLTKISFVDYDPEAYSDRFIKFIDEVMSGDLEKAVFLQKSLGYGISGDTRFECMFFLYGETTRNGTNDVADMFRAIIEDREPPKVEKVINGHTGFLFYDENDMPLVAMHWQHRFNHMVGRYKDIYKVQMPNITPHVCRHTYCSNQAKAGMNPKTLQYLMGHSDISVTMNVYTHFGFDDAEEELKRMEEFRKAQTEVEKKKEKPMMKRMFKAI